MCWAEVAHPWHRLAPARIFDIYRPGGTLRNVQQCHTTLRVRTHLAQRSLHACSLNTLSWFAAHAGASSKHASPHRAHATSGLASASLGQPASLAAVTILYRCSSVVLMAAAHMLSHGPVGRGWKYWRPWSCCWPPLAPCAQKAVAQVSHTGHPHRQALYLPNPAPLANPNKHVTFPPPPPHPLAPPPRHYRHLSPFAFWPYRHERGPLQQQQLQANASAPVRPSSHKPIGSKPTHPPTAAACRPLLPHPSADSPPASLTQLLPPPLPPGAAAYQLQPPAYGVLGTSPPSASPTPIGAPQPPPFPLPLPPAPRQSPGPRPPPARPRPPSPRPPSPTSQPSSSPASPPGPMPPSPPAPTVATVPVAPPPPAPPVAPPLPPQPPRPPAPPVTPVPPRPSPPPAPPGGQGAADEGPPPMPQAGLAAAAPASSSAGHRYSTQPCVMRAGFAVRG